MVKKSRFQEIIIDDLLALLLPRTADLYPDRVGCLVVGRTDRAMGGAVSEAAVEERGEQIGEGR